MEKNKNFKSIRVRKQPNNAVKNKQIVRNEKKKKIIPKKKHDQKPQHRKVLSVDPRSPLQTTTLSNDQVPTNMNPAASFTCEINPSSVVGPVLAVVSYALSRGYQQNVDAADPYYAAVYMTQFILDRMANATPKISKVPYWLACLADAVTAKRVKSQAGFINFKYDIKQLDASDVFGVLMQLGNSQYGFRWNCGSINDTVVNDYFHEITTTNNYNVVDGEKAYTSLAQWLENVDPREGSANMHRLVPSTFRTRFIFDASAFSVVSPNPGGGFYDSGGFLTQLQLEVPPRSPIFAGLCPGKSSGLYRAGRYPRFIKTFSGDSIFTGGMLSNVLREHQLHMKKPSEFHFVDFLEFLDVIGKVLVQVGQHAVADGQVLQAEVTSPGSIAKLITCPLTLQEVGLVLRATMMNAFSNSQYMVQGIYPCVAGSANDSQFTAFACGVGTCPSATTTAMLLPVVLVENIRSLTMRINVGHRGESSNPAVYMPVLGQYFRDKLVANDYTVNLVTTSGTDVIPVFATDVEFKNVIIDPASKREKIISAEVPINFEDGSAGSQYLAINDPGGLNTLTAKWNEYISNVNSFLRDLDTVGTDAGIDSLYMGIFTSYWSQIQQPQEELTHDRFRKDVDLSATFGTKRIIGVSSSEVPFKTNWETIQNTWIAPSMKINVGSGPNNDTSFQRIAAAQGEVIEIPAAMTTTPFTLGVKHTQLATLCVKSRNAEKYSIGEFFADEAKKGRGGILSSIAASFLPIAANVATNLLTNLP